jgi:acyl carrier protein
MAIFSLSRPLPRPADNATARCEGARGTSRTAPAWPAAAEMQPRRPLTFRARQHPMSAPAATHAAHPLSTGIYTGLTMSNVSELAPRDVILKIVADFLARQSVTRTIRPDDNLRDAGLTSMDMVNIVLKVESACGVTIPDREITPANFRSVATIDNLITSLRRG